MTLSWLSDILNSMLKIRLMRIGAKKRPFYRVVVIDERSKRSGEYLELLGTYNPLTEPHEINLKQDRIDHWTKQGAQMSDGYLRMVGKAPQRPARKPKKENKEAPTPVVTSTEEKSEQPVEEQPTSEANEAPIETPIKETTPANTSEEGEEKNEGSA